MSTTERGVGANAARCAERAGVPSGRALHSLRSTSSMIISGLKFSRGQLCENYLALEEIRPLMDFEVLSLKGSLECRDDKLFVLYFSCSARKI